MLRKNQILLHFDLSIFSLGQIIKKLQKGAAGGPAQFLSRVSIVIVTDIIAILLTPGIFLIQISIKN